MPREGQITISLVSLRLVDQIIETRAKLDIEIAKFSPPPPRQVQFLKLKSYKPFELVYELDLRAQLTDGEPRMIL